MATSALQAEIKEQHLAIAAGTPDEELLKWSQNVYDELKEAERALVAARTRSQELDAARRAARVENRRLSTPATATAWRQSVTAAEEAQETLRKVRDQRNRHQVLSDLLSGLLRQRRAITGSSHGKQRGAAPVEPCPYCEHTYTVRDGTLSQTDAEGNRLQLRKCHCREMAPPCKNCPTCKTHATLMAAQGDDQLRMCRDEVQCAICACECPGAGKWIENDADSRAAFKSRTAKRHSMLSTLLQTSWSGGEGGSGGSGGIIEGDHAHAGKQVQHSEGEGGASYPSRHRADAAATLSAETGGLRRLPADIKDQIEAIAAAQSLMGVLSVPSASGATGSYGERTCCGETLAVAGRKRRRSPIEAAMGKGGGGGCLHGSGGGGAVEGEAHKEQQEHHRRHHHHHHHHQHDDNEEEHHFNHMHRCDHPHDECNSDCCSAI